MKKISKSLLDRFLSKTPRIAKGLQVLAAAFAAVPYYYNTLPAQFQEFIPASVMQYSTWGGLAVAVALQFLTTKKQK